MDTAARHSRTLSLDARALWRVACAAVLALRPLRAAAAEVGADPADLGTAFGLDAAIEADESAPGPAAH